MATANKVWDVLLKATVPISIIIGGALIGHEVRISRIEASRFTNADGLRLERDIRSWIDTRFPGKAEFQGLREDVSEIREAVKRLEAAK